MTSTTKILRYAVTAAIIILVAGLAGWYFFLNKQGQAITATDAGRGLGSPLPFGGDTGSTYGNVTGSDASPQTGGDGKALPRLWRVAKTPVAGMGFVTAADNASSSVQLYFAERGTGYILKADIKTGSLTRLTNKLFPKVYEAVFGSDGAFVLRSMDDEGHIVSFAGDAPEKNILSASSSKNSASPTAVLAGAYLSRDIREIVPRAGTHDLVLLVPGVGGGADVILSSWNGAKQKTLFSSPLSGWKLFSLSDERIFLSLAPSDDTAGYAFEIKNEALIPRLRDIPGLTFLPRSLSDAALFGRSDGGDVSLFFSPKEAAGAVYLPIRTVADKCVWAPFPVPQSGKQAKATSPGLLIAYCAVPDNFPSKNFLADWYMGVVHTSDTWWRIDADTGEATPVLEPGDMDQEFDVENPMIDSAGEQIAFMDARDKSLWLLRINAPEKP